MTRIVPPWIYTERNGRPVVVLSGAEYPVDPAKRPVFFFRSYLAARFPRGWTDSKGNLGGPDGHPLSAWFREFDEFVREFDRRGPDGEYRDLMTAKMKCAFILASDMFTLDGNQALQDVLINRLGSPTSFQAARHELSVAATMARAMFDLRFENERDSSRKHPEFVATHRRSGVRVAVEAKSIHRRGVLGFQGGNPAPTMETASGHKIAAQICGQVQRALPKASGLPLYVFVDLNLPPSIAEAVGPDVMTECNGILPQIDTGYDENGMVVGRTMNLLTVTNWAMHLGEEGHQGGETLNIFANPPGEDCAFPDASKHVPEVKAAIKQYGTVEQA